MSVRRKIGFLPERFGKIAVAHSPTALGLPALPGLRTDQVLVSDELMTVLLKNGARKIATANDEHFLVVLFQLFDKGNEIAIAADNNKGIDVVPRECHLQRV